ncbi:hypothetical protein C6558_01440 [Ensifer sp. NM-2]|nr:hypothetical protein [Ensifer canadensis]PSS66728.1 hypothetical protein C6558_01440 [Ensifer sp. NM-2]
MRLSWSEENRVDQSPYLAKKPLTLTLSPQAGRGNVPCVDEASAAKGTRECGVSLLPVKTGRRWRQPNEGPLTAHRYAESLRPNGACVPARPASRTA